MSAFCLGASFLIFVANFVWSICIDPQPAPANPWDSRGLEWQTADPVPEYNFERIPVVLGDPYNYGEADAVPVADLTGATFAAAANGGGANGMAGATASSAGRTSPPTAPDDPHRPTR